MWPLILLCFAPFLPHIFQFQPLTDNWPLWKRSSFWYGRSQLEMSFPWMVFCGPIGVLRILRWSSLESYSIGGNIYSNLYRASFPLMFCEMVCRNIWFTFSSIEWKNTFPSLNNISAPARWIFLSHFSHPDHWHFHKINENPPNIVKKAYNESFCYLILKWQSIPFIKMCRHQAGTVFYIGLAHGFSTGKPEAVGWGFAWFLP